MVVTPTELVGHSIERVVIGWFRAGDLDQPGRLFLCLRNGVELEACTGSSFRFERRSVPADFSVGDGMAYVFDDAPPTHPVARLIGHEITRVESILWNGWQVGVVIHGGDLRAVVADEADEVYVAIEELPVDYADASIIDVTGSGQR